MTSALLHRSRAFRRLGGVDVGILTLDDRPDYPELEQRLLCAGELVAGVRIRNLWDDPGYRSRLALGQAEHQQAGRLMLGAVVVGDPRP